MVIHYTTMRLGSRFNVMTATTGRMLHASEMGGRVTCLKKILSSVISAIWQHSYLQNPILDGHYASMSFDFALNLERRI